MNAIMITALVLLGTLSMSTGLIVGSELQNVPPQNYCGGKLARAMAVVCADIWENDYQKRSAPVYGGEWSPFQTYKHHLRHARSVIQVQKAAPKSNRNKRGVVEDCCENVCTIDTLQSYC